MNFAKNNSGMDPMLMILLALLLFPNILGSLGDNPMMLIILFLVLSGGLGF